MLQVLLGVVRRATYMASRAYRPNNLLIDALTYTQVNVLCEIGNAEQVCL